MKKIYFSFILMLISAFTFSQWILQSSPTTNALGSVKFPYINTGYAVGATGTIIKTTDAGTNWTLLTSNTANNLNQICCEDESIAYAVGNSGTIIKTTNGGSNWLSQTSGITNVLRSICYADINTYYAVGDAGRILKTTNGGANWTQITSGTSSSLCYVSFTDVNTGYIVGGNGIILKTTNAGTNWSTQASGTTNTLYSIYFTDVNTAYIVGGVGKILKTTNAGTNWSTQTSGTTNTLYISCFTDITTGYAVGNTGTILVTTNGGANWANQSPGTTNHLTSVYFTDTNTGYIVGVGGTILKTTNGGWCTSKAGTPTGPTTVCASGPSQYTTAGATNAASYIWSITPVAAGTISGTGLTATVTWNGTYSGTAQITVKGHNTCGDGPVSDPIVVTVYPAIGGTVSGGGNICIGSSTGTLTLNGYVGDIIKWQKRVDNGSWIDIANTNNTYSETPSSIGVWDYRAEVQSGVCPVFSGLASVIVVDFPGNAGPITGLTTVCQGQNSVTYTVSPIIYATSYIWTLPAGASGTSSTSSITVSYGTSAVSGNITVKGNNVCGSGGISILAVTVNPLPDNAGIIIGPTTVCQGQNGVIYSVPVIPNATSYIWTLPAGATGTSSTNSITVNYGVTAISGNIVVRGSNSCGNGAISVLPISVNTLPSSAGSISGPASVCQGQNGVIYSVPIIPNATTYIWTLPNGATGTSTTNTITVSYGFSAVSGNITVKGNNSCGDGGMSSLSITVNTTPGAAGTIAGLSTVCQGQNGVIYSVPVIANATSYIWTLPSGASGSSSTNSITVNFGLSAVSGDITVKGHNNCGDGTTSSLTITVNSLPAAAGTLTGSTTVCQGQIGVIYSVPVIANATSYVWTLPSGATGSSSTNSITVDFGSTAVSGDITVKGHNSCGDGTISSLFVTVLSKPVTPIITLNGNVLHSDAPTGNQWYDQNGLINGATNQDYTVTVNGDYYVIVTINGCSSDPSNIISIINVGIGNIGNFITLRLYPNPVSNELIIEITGNTEKTNFQILNSTGQIVYKGSMVEKMVVKTEDLSPGVYMIKFENGKSFEFRKIVKE
jgi:photosystem II stability/assembly factor-like uncharacterized protein